MAKQFTREEVAKHNTAESLWIIIDSDVYNLTSFLDLHPGGAHLLLDLGGKDATQDFYALHRQNVLDKYQRLKVGSISGETKKVLPIVPGSLSVVPFAEPTWLNPMYHSPYYKESHRNLQKVMRLHVETDVIPEAHVAEQTGARPSAELIKKQSDVNLHAMRLGPGPHLKGLELFGGVKPEEFDYFHELVITQEIARLGSRGFADGMQVN